MRGIDAFFASRDPFLDASVSEAVDNIVRAILNNPEDEEAENQARERLAGNAPGSHRLFAGLAEFLGTESYGLGPRGAAFSIFHSTVDSLDPGPRAAFEEKLRTLENDLQHPYRRADAQFILGSTRLTKGERVPLAEFERLVRDEDPSAVARMLIMCSGDLHRWGIDEGDYEYIESELTRLLPGLVSMLGAPASTDRAPVRRYRAALALIEGLYEHPEFRPAFARFLVERLSGQAELDPDRTFRALVRLRATLGEDFDRSLRGAIDELPPGISADPTIVLALNAEVKPAWRPPE